MQRLLSTTIAIATLTTTILISGNLPVISHLTESATAQQVTAKKPIVLKLSQAKKVADKKGFKLVPVTKAEPGDVIVYSIAANNVSNKPVSKLVINQKIRPGTIYVLNSATAVPDTTLTFSIDGGKSYSDRPTIDKKPAPASNYTNVRWAFNGSLAPQAQSNLSYEVRIR